MNKSFSSQRTDSFTNQTLLFFSHEAIACMSC